MSRSGWTRKIHVFQFEECNIDCAETKRYSGWTPWLAVNASLQSGSVGYVEKRFRFSCRAQTNDPSSVRVQLAKEEERYCRNDGSCLRGNANANVYAESINDNGWGEWSAWGTCDRPCGRGTQHRVSVRLVAIFAWHVRPRSRRKRFLCSLQGRQCKSPPCEGLSTQSRICNSHPCRTNSGAAEGQWSCWTEWSECSASCGFGTRTRTRECLGPDSCVGPRLVREACEMLSCESLLGWDTWTHWTPCDGDRQQHRKRTCLQHGPAMCQGSTRETRDCLPDCTDNGESVGIILMLGEYLARGRF